MADQVFVQNTSLVESSTVNNYYLKTGKAYLEHEDYTKAIEVLELAILLEPGNMEAQALLREAKGRFGEKRVLPEAGDKMDMPEVISIQSKQTIQNKDIQNQKPIPTAEGCVKAAKTYFDSKDYSRAIDMLELAVLLEPNNKEAKRLLCDSRYQLLEEKKSKDIHDGVSISQKITAELPGQTVSQNENMQSSEPYNLKTDTLLKESKQALEDERTPGDTSILIQNAYTAIKEKRYDDAAAIANLILETDPTNRDALYIKGKINDIKYIGIVEYLKTIYAQEKLKSNEYLKELSIPYQDIMRFPPKEQWRDILNRTLPDMNEIVEENRQRTEQLRIGHAPLDNPLPKDIETALNTIISFEFVDTTLKDVVIFLMEKININMVVDPEAGSASITLKLKDVPLRTALTYILPKGYEYVIEGDIIHVYKQKMEMCVYDVRDILINLDDKDPLEFDITASYSQMSLKKRESIKIKDPSERLLDLIEMIVTTIEPSSWSYRTSVIGISHTNSQRRINIPGQGEGTVTARMGQPGDLVIVNTKYVHSQIENLLASLRSSQNLQVSIEARFVTVSDKFLEDIGSNFSKFFSDNTSIDTGAGNVTGDLGDAAVAGLDLQYSILSNSMLRGLIKAIQQSQDSEILTSPRITLSNTQRGNIAVVQTINYVQSTSVSEGIVTPVIGTIPEGTTFDVRPIVSADRKYVYLEVTPSVFDVEAIDEFTFSTGFGTDTTISGGGTGVVSIPPTSKVQLPRINVSQVSVTVCVPDKSTLMIGGLGAINRKTFTTGIPLLSKIPIIKKLFTRTRKDNEKSNLIILLKPTIIIKKEQEANFFKQAKKIYD